MIGAILAGGFGKRLKPLTNEIPKALIQIKNDYTIMDRQLYDFRNMGIKDVYILSGYLGNKIEERYGDEKDGLRFHYFREEKPLGTLFSLRNLFDNRSDEDLVLRNGDTVTDLNFNQFASFAQNSPYNLTMFATRMKSPYGILETFGDQIVNFREKPYLEYYINSGVYYIKKEAFQYFFRAYLEKDIETTVFPYLANLKMVGAYKEDTMWLGIDSEKDLELVRQEYSTRTDTPWGYRKTLFEENGKEISEYFIKSGETAEIDVNEKTIFRGVYGSGLILDDNRKFQENSVIPVNSRISVKALENSMIEMITL